MNNQVAAPCCGSCKHVGMGFSYSNPSAVCWAGDKAFAVQLGILRCKNNYTPRNPISIIDIPGVKELVKCAWAEGWNKALEDKE